MHGYILLLFSFFFLPNQTKTTIINKQTNKPTKNKQTNKNKKQKTTTKIIIKWGCPGDIRTVTDLHVGPIEADALGGQLVNVGSDHVAFSIAAQLGPEVVHHQEQHVGPRGRC